MAISIIQSTSGETHNAIYVRMLDEQFNGRDQALFNLNGTEIICVLWHNIGWCF